MGKRLEYIDQIRGLAIMLVVIGHIIQFNNIQGGMNNIVFNIIYSFHMPLFFCISGYIGFKTIRIFDFKSYRQHLWKKFISLLIPLFTWSLLVNQLFFSQHWNLITINNITMTILNPGLWFLKTLFEIFFFYGFFAWISSIKNRNNQFWLDLLIFLLILILTTCYNILCGNGIFSSLLLYTLFFYLAVFISKYSIIEKIVMNQWGFASSFFLFIILTGHWNINGTKYDDILKIIISSLSFIIFLNITIRLKWQQFVSRQIMTFGQYSLAIYIIQFYLTHFTVDTHVIIFDNISPIILFIICVVISIPICYLSIGIAKLIELNNILNFIFLGKRVQYNLRWFGFVIRASQTRDF